MAVPSAHTLRYSPRPKYTPVYREFDALFAKFNYRIKWFDGWENHKLNLENYNSGPAAPYNSWALLEKED